VAADFPNPGQVFEYRYLWRWQKASGETEGRKPRPCCVAIVVQTDAGETMLFVAPITSKPPASGRIGLQVPVTEAKRAKLDQDAPLWVMVDELNADILERSYVLEDRVPRGSFSARFLDEIVREIQTIRARGKLQVSGRA
jgi:hypothetical protein